jgi:hypothetical protein
MVCSATTKLDRVRRAFCLKLRLSVEATRLRALPSLEELHDLLTVGDLRRTSVNDPAALRLLVELQRPDGAWGPRASPSALHVDEVANNSLCDREMTAPAKSGCLALDTTKLTSVGESTESRASSVSAGSSKGESSKPNSSIGRCEVCQDFLIKSSRCTKCKEVQYCSRACQLVHWPFHKLLCAPPTPAAATDSINPHYHSKVATKSVEHASKQLKAPRKGLCGLENLGNTCYMNSALQCLSHTYELAGFFTSERYKADENSTNVLGTQGRLAREFSDLLKKLWFGTAMSLPPTPFRMCVARHCETFANARQHDAHELINWVLDTLHEDCNRVTTKPYRSLPDSAGRPDAVVAQESWEAHLARNQSRVIDYFCGQYKSTVCCTECGYTSVSFDPFTTTTLPIPGVDDRHIPVLLFPRGGGSPARVTLQVRASGTVWALKAAIVRSARAFLEARDAEANIEPDDGELCLSLTVVNYVASRFFNEYSNFKLLSELKASATVSVFHVHRSEAGARAAKGLIQLRCLHLAPRSTASLSAPEKFDNTSRTTELFGLPLLFDIPQAASTARLYICVAEALSRSGVVPSCARLLAQHRDATDQWTKSPASFADPNGGFELATACATELQALFSLSIVDKAGEKCGRCPKREKCLGCELPFATSLQSLWGNGLGLSDRSTLAVQWKPKTMQLYVREVAAQSLDLSATVGFRSNEVGRPLTSLL